MKKYSLVVIFLFFVQIAIADEGRFTVGVSLPLTGALAEYGEAVQNGIEFARFENPAQLSDIQFIYEDNAYDPKQAAATLQKLVDLDQVNLFLVWGNEPALSVAPISDQRKIPTIAIAQYPQASLGRNFVIRFINSGREYSETLLSYLRTQKLSKIGIIKSELSFFNMLVDGLERAKTEERIEVIDTFLPSDNDFRTSISKLKSRQFDILGVYLIPPQVGQFFKQAAELDFHPRTFGATPFESKSVIAGAWSLMNGAIFTHNAVTAIFRSK